MEISSKKTGDIVREKTWTWLRKENLKRGTESLLVTVQNKALRASYIKARTDNNTKWNSECRLCGDKNETIHHIISECIKLEQKEYKIKYGRAKKLIHSEFDHNTWWYIGKPVSVFENETYKILWDFEIQTDHLIPVRRSNLVLINKDNKSCHLVFYTVPTDERIKNKRKWKGKYTLRPFQTTPKPKNKTKQKTLEHEGEGDTNRNGFAWNDPKRKLWKMTGGIENRRRNRGYLDHLEFWEESEKPGETYYHSDSCESSTANAGEKNFNWVK